MRLVTILLFVLLTSVPALAVPLTGDCNIFFFGSSTLHDFEGKGSCIPFTLEIGGDGQLHPTSLQVPVAGLDTDNSSRDKKMREMFEAGKYPQISGRLTSTDGVALRRQLHQAFKDGSAFPLKLRIRDLEQQLDARVIQLIDNDRTLSIDLEFPLSLESYQLEPPSVLFITVDDGIRVRVSLHLAPLPTPWQP